MSPSLEIYCGHCRNPIRGEKMAYTEQGGRYHPLKEMPDNGYAPNCVNLEELSRFRASAGRNFFNKTKADYAEKFKHIFPGLYKENKI